FHKALIEGRGLTGKLIHYVGVVLCEQCWNDIPLRGKIEYIKMCPAIVVVSGTARVDVGESPAFTGFQGKVFKGQRFFVVKLFLCIWILFVAVIHALVDIGSLRSQSNIKGFGPGTHRKEVSSGGGVVLDLQRYIELE